MPVAIAIKFNATLRNSVLLVRDSSKIDMFFIQAGINRSTQPTIWTVKFSRPLDSHTAREHDESNAIRVNNPARQARLRDQANKLRERVKRSTLAFLERSQARFTWLQRSFRVSMVADWAIFTNAKTLLSAFMALLGLASSKKSSLVAFHNGILGGSIARKQIG